MNKKLSFNVLLVIILLSLGAFVNVFHTVVDHMSVYIGRETTASGMMLSVYALGSLVSLLIISSFADHAGKRIVVSVSLLIMVAGLMLMYLTSSPFLIFLGLFLFGFGFAPTESMSSALIGDENPQNTSFWMNLSQAGFSIGAILGPILTMAYLSKNQKFQGVFLFCAIIAMLLCIAMLLSNISHKKSNAAETEKPKLNMFDVLKDKRMRVLALLIFLYLGYESVSPAYTKQLFLRNGNSESLAAGMISLFWGAMIIGRLLGTMNSGKELRAIPRYTLFVVLGSVLLISTKILWLNILAVAMIGFGCGPVWPMLVSLAVSLFPERSGSTMGIMMLCSMAGITLFPPLIGTLPGNVSITFICTAVIAASVIAITNKLKTIYAQNS